MPLIQVLEVSKAPLDPARRMAWALDLPIESQLFDGLEVEISGWVVAAEGVDAIEVVQSGTVVRRVRVDRVRVDVGLLYPDIAASDRSGFRTTLFLAEWREARISIFAVLASGSSILLGEVLARRTWRETALKSDVQFASIAIYAKATSERVAATVESVRAQSYPHFEIVLIGDSSDGIAREVASRFAGVRAVDQPEQGLPAAWNTGLRRTIGDYVMFLEASDCLLPDALRLGLWAFREHQESAVVLGHRRAPAKGENPSPSCVLDAGLGLFRRSVFDSVGIFNIAAADPGSEMCRRIMRQFPCYCHHQPVVDSEPK